MCLLEEIMRSWRPLRIVVLAVLCSTAICCRRDTRRDDEAAIRAATREWNAAEAAKDLDKCVSFYADDGERLATGSPAIRGAAALRDEWRKYLSSSGTFQWRTAKVEVSSSGDLAYETGTYVLKTVGRNGHPITTNGKYVCVWKKQRDGQWKVVEDIDNPDNLPGVISE